MTSQQEADLALAEHRAVMAAHFKACVNRPTEDQYEALLTHLRGVMTCTPADPFGIDHDCEHAAGHQFESICGDVICIHCGRIS